MSTKPSAYGIRFYTQRPTTEFEDWLAHHCDQGWEIRFGDLREGAEGDLEKQLIVAFETPTDRGRFQQAFMRP